MQTKKEDISLYFKDDTNEIEKAKKENNSYGTTKCPFCRNHAISDCRCSGPHSLEDLKNSHGLRCSNGHYFNYDGKIGYDPKTGNVIGEDISSEPSSEMFEYFMLRTDNHITLVKDNMKKVAEHLNPIQKQIFLPRCDQHDQSKFKEPNFTPYVWLTWMYKCKKDNIPFKYPEGMKEKCDDATTRHILMEPHHPEYFSNDIPDVDPNNRDKLTKAIDATNMPALNIMEMICDWKAVGQERGGSARQWYEKNVPSRWEFDDKQKQLIEETFENIGIKK